MVWGDKTRKFLTGSSYFMRRSNSLSRSSPHLWGLVAQGPQTGQEAGLKGCIAAPQKVGGSWQFTDPKVFPLVIKQNSLSRGTFLDLSKKCKDFISPSLPRDSLMHYCSSFAAPLVSSLSLPFPGCTELHSLTSSPSFRLF